MSLICLPTGIMITKVMKMASLARTWLGGICIVPMAWRRKEKTMMIRVNEVTVNKMAGATDNTVSRKRISRATETDSGSAWPPLSVMLSEGTAGWAEAMERGRTKKSRSKPIRLAGSFPPILFQMRGEGCVVLVMAGLRKQGDGRVRYSE